MISSSTVRIASAAIVLLGCGTPQQVAPAPQARQDPTATAKPEFPTQRPEKRMPPIAGQSDALKNFAVPLDISEPEAVPAGLGMGAGQFIEPIRSTLLRIESLAGYSFDWQFSPMLNDGGMAYPGGVIVVNPNRMSMYPADAAFFGLLHEAGHHVLGHTSAAGVVTGMQQPWLLPAMEMQADAWAARRLKQAGINPNRILVAAMALVGSSPGDQAHPPGTVRVQAIAAALQAP